jgi:hypothetical protein
MRALASIVVVALAAAPGAVAADRGALTVELGPTLTVLGASPSQGSGSTTLATAGGGALGVRFALSNELELAATGLWEAPADYVHSDVDVGTATGTVRGTFSERVQRYGLLAGVRYVRGFVWRLHLGLDVGWSRETFTRRDLLDVSDPGNVHSFGLGLQDRTTDALVLAPVVGLEWQFGDHWSVSVTPRAQILIGATNSIGFVVPVSLGYSWYVF